MNCAIVIPVYKENPGANELHSLVQCAKIFAKRDIRLICPVNLHVGIYEQVFKNCNYCVARFDSSYFDSLSAYSKLLLKPEFYMQFFEYDYVLIYQSDAWVFKDELDYWCKQGYSYIGAPWFKDDKILNIAGNGGFSLRKVSDMIKLLSSKKSVKYSPREYSESFLKQFDLTTVLSVAYKYFMHFFYNVSFWESTVLNEDYAIVKYSKRIMSEFSCAPPDVAMKFSFEVHPEILYKMNACKLPFGCHGYLKYNSEFWEKFIL